MDNVLYQDAYDVLSGKVDKTLRVVSRIRDELKKMPTNQKISLHSFWILQIVMRSKNWIIS